METMPVEDGRLIYCSECEWSSDILLEYPIIEIEIVERGEIRESKDE